MEPVTVLLIAAGVLAALILVIWAGVSVRPAAFPTFAPAQDNLPTVPLPPGLPAPVERFYRQTYGERVPVIETAVLSGRGRMRLFGLMVPLRFRFTHEAGRSFRHDIHLTFFGLPFMKGFETFIDGRGWANIPGYVEGEGFDQGSNVSLWAEALKWFPALLVTDPRVTWKPVDADTALAEVPFKDGKEVFVVRFHPRTGALEHIEALKYKTEATGKVLWDMGVWSDERRPWIELNVEETILNAPVSEYIRAPRP